MEGSGTVRTTQSAMRVITKPFSGHSHEGVNAELTAVSANENMRLTVICSKYELATCSCMLSSVAQAQVTTSCAEHFPQISQNQFYKNTVLFYEYQSSLARRNVTTVI